MFAEVKTRYMELRKMAYEFTKQQYFAYPVEFREIRYGDAVAADKWRAQWKEPNKRPIWSWVDMYHKYQGPNALKRFDMALVSGGNAVALCYGIPSKNKMILKIHTIARDPVANPLEGMVMEIILFAVNAYAGLLDSREVWLCEPMNALLVKKYEQFGYIPQTNKLGKVTHLSLEVRYE